MDLASTALVNFTPFCVSFTDFCSFSPVLLCKNALSRTQATLESGGWQVDRGGVVGVAALGSAHMVSTGGGSSVLGIFVSVLFNLVPGMYERCVC